MLIYTLKLINIDIELCFVSVPLNSSPIVLALFVGCSRVLELYFILIVSLFNFSLYAISILFEYRTLCSHELLNVYLILAQSHTKFLSNLSRRFRQEKLSYVNMIPFVSLCLVDTYKVYSWN